jgi:dimethylhistidine N-methyltransferase
MHDVSAVLWQEGNVFLADVIGGLSAVQKTLPCRWLYDKLGSDLFEAITRVEEYYPTRAETEILRIHAPEIAAFAGDGPVLVEYGAGAGVKTSLVLTALNSPCGYVPVDIAGEYLAQTVETIARRFPALWVRPVASDFLSVFDMPAGVPAGQRIAFFPGSTIGNLDRREATAFLTQMRRHVGVRGGAIVGVDLLKDVSTLVRAYDDAAGVTAQFNLNLLARINRELGGDFRLECFRHEARWNGVDRAVEMHLVSVREQWVSVGEVRFHFEHGETIHTESSRKYDLDGFKSLAADAGWDVLEAWLDAKGQFCVFAMRVSNEVALH